MSTIYYTCNTGKRLREHIKANHEGLVTVPMVPLGMRGLGFGFKWNMGWMHDMLDYTAKEPVHRKDHQNKTLPVDP